MTVDIYHVHDGVECPNTEVANRLLAENRKMKAELDRERGEGRINRAAERSHPAVEAFREAKNDPWEALKRIVQTYRCAVHPTEQMHEIAAKALARREHEGIPVTESADE